MTPAGLDLLRYDTRTGEGPATPPFSWRRPRIQLGEMRAAGLTVNLRESYLKVSFHSTSQGSHSSQQACVCDAYWYGHMAGTHSAKFGEGLLYSQSSRTCSCQLLRTPTKFLGLLRGMETKNTCSQCSFVWEVQFWSYSFMWEVAKCDMHNHGIL